MRISLSIKDPIYIILDTITSKKLMIKQTIKYQKADRITTS